MVTRLVLVIRNVGTGFDDAANETNERVYEEHVYITTGEKCYFWGFVKNKNNAI